MTQETKILNNRENRPDSNRESIGSMLIWFFSFLLSAVLLFLVFTPINILAKLFGLPILTPNWDEDKFSFWNKR